ncbi:hypothetical protein [Priestia megaterium]|uniref:hypothetical protein n=1 Tax=Priestia megaterium TaxID=1404 RepID=UPI002E1C2807|nr:hypothetical protein [Priestia megaterium]
MKKTWIITQDEKDQYFVDTINRIQKNVEALREMAIETKEQNVEVSCMRILKDLKALKIYR